MPEERGPHFGPASSLGPGVGPEKDSQSLSKESGQPFPPSRCRLRNKAQPGVRWGSRLEKGLLTSELTMLVALRPSWVPGRKGREGSRMAFSVH